jgi:hypothetical protein
LKHKFSSVILWVSLLAAMASCSTERKIAKEFLQQRDSISVLLIPPDYLFKTNLNAHLIEGSDELDAAEKDRVLLDSSRFLRFVDDTMIMARYYSAMESTLRKYGIYTYRQDEIVEFMETGKMAYQVANVQLEIEESIYPYRAQDVFQDTVVFYEDFDLDRVSINSWFEISKLNDAGAVNNVLYASDFVTDELEGRFVSNIFTGEVKFKYNMYPLETEDIYSLAARAGQRYAGYIFDYIMNQYIYFGFPQGRQPATYLTYDHDARLLYPASDNRFIFLDE